MSSSLRVAALAAAAASLAFATGCSTTISTLQPAETVGRNKWHVGVAQDVSIPVGRVTSVTSTGATTAAKILADSSYKPTDQDRREILDAGLGLMLNPPGTTPDVMVRYGFVDGFDAGVRYSGTQVHLDAKAQFLTTADGWAGSVSIGYSRHLYSSTVFDVLEVLDVISFQRHNLELPVQFGHRLGDYGHLWMGAKYIGSYYRMDSALAGVGLPSTAGLMHYVGLNSGIALGYKYVFAMAELTAMEMIAKPEVFGQPVDIGGLVIMPAVGVMARFP